MKMRKQIRTLALLLVPTLLAQLLPLSVFAAQSKRNQLPQTSLEDTELTNTSPAAETTEKTPEAYVLGEYAEYRGESEKHFRMSDGSFLAVDYGAPVHWSADGEAWNDIDNTLRFREARDETGAAAYVAENGDRSARFAATLESGELFAVSSKASSAAFSLSVPENRHSEPVTDVTGVGIRMPDAEETDCHANAAAPARNDDVQTCNPDAKAEITNPEKLPEPASGVPLAEQLRLERLESEVLYRDVWPGVDLHYQLSGFNVKESIVVNAPQEISTFSFRMALDGLTPALQEDGAIALLDADGEAAYWIPAPFMTDAGGAYSDAVSYVLTEIEAEKSEAGEAASGEEAAALWQLTVAADPDWLNAEARTYPVEIDPTVIYIGNGSNKIVLTSYVNSANTTSTSTQNTAFLRSGYSNQDSYCMGHTVGLIYVDQLPDVPTGCVVNGAYLEFTQTDYNGINNSGYHRLYATTINTPGNPLTYLSGRTWNNYLSDILPYYWKPDPDEAAPALDYNKEFLSSGKKTVYTITGAAQRWYDPNDTSISRLLVLDNGHTSTTNARITYAGYAYGTTSYRPKIYVSYRNTNGVDGVSDSHTQNVGRAGTGYVNDYTLKTALSVPLLSYPSTALPFSLSLNYSEGFSNSQFSGNDSAGLHTASFSTSKMGCGWKLSAQQTVKSLPLQYGSSTKTHLVYTDASGTEHYFYKDTGSNDYKDEEGLNLTITGSDASYTMTDKTGNTWIFTFGYLTSYTDANGNALYYSYDGVNYSENATMWKPSDNSNPHQLTGVWRKNHGCAVEHLVAVTYASGHLSAVTDMAGRTTAFGYSNTDATALTSIDFPDGQHAIYAYSVDNGYYRLAQAEDREAGYRIDYTYQSNHPLRVLSYSESTRTGSGQNISWELGQRVNCYQHGANYSRFRYFEAGDTNQNSPGKLVTLHYFDSVGRTVNVLTMNPAETEILGVSSGTYTNNSGTNAKNNRLKSAASAGLQTTNLIKNADLEHATALQYWTASGSGSASAVSAEGDVKPHGGNRMVRLSSGGNAPGESLQQTLSLKAGTTYVFSAYVNSSAASGMVDGGGACLEVSGERSLTYQDNLYYKTSDEISGGWERISTVFTTNAPTNGVNYRDYVLSLKVGNPANVIYFDDVQLEEAVAGGAASSFNLVQAGSFELNGTGGVSSTTNLGDWWSYSTAQAAPSATQAHSGSYSMTFAPNATAKRRATQTIPINDTANKTWLLSAWGWTPQTNLYSSKELSGDNADSARFFGVIARVNYANSAYDPDYFYLSFNGDISNWQYATATIVPTQAAAHPEAVVSTITLSCALDYCVNRTYIDDVSLTAEPVQTYDYDGDGNLTSAANSEGKTETAYDGSNRLTAYTALNGVEYTLSYTGTSRNPDSVASDNLTSAYSYDAAGNTTQTETSGTGTKKLRTGAVYGGSKNYQTEATDANGVTVHSSYDPNTGYLLTSTAPTASGGSIVTNYSTIASNGRPYSSYQTGIAALYYGYVEDGSISKLSRKGYRNNSEFWQSYHFAYDDWGHTTEITVSGSSNTQNTGDGMELASYTYDASGKMTSMHYPNGNYVVYEYDAFDRLVHTVYYNREQTPRTVQAEYCYVYNGNGALAKQYEKKNGLIETVYTFEYDSLGRLIRSREDARTNEGMLPTQHTEHLYDTANRLASQRWEIDGKSFSESFRYNDPADTGTPLGDGSLYQFTAATGSRLTYSYDGLKRLSTVSVASSLGNPLFYTGRNYADGAETDQTTNRISVTSYRKTNGTLIAGTGFLYEYDAAGNLSRVREMVTDSTYRTLAEYSYDSQNQLSYEVRYSYVGNNLTGSLTSLHYFYDTAGNLLKVEENDVEIETYAYGNAKWQDLLTAYNGHTILYEGQTGSNTAPLSGNPITWYNGSGTEFTSLYWEQGRRLRSMQYQDAANQYQADFRYDMDGIRTEKNVDGRIHKYVTQSGKVMRETVCEGSTLQYTLDFVYDAGGQPFALIRTMPDNTKTTYYYVLNAQGDVVKLINASGTTYATYRYDAWGRVLSATGTLAEINPLRYRGYYYDTETGWYYLQSRYYDPIVKRFINADSYGSTGTGFLGFNMFAYCVNCPVNAVDSAGHRPKDIQDDYQPVPLEYNEYYVKPTRSTTSVNSLPVKSYPSPLEAVKAFGLLYHRSSLAQQLEYGSYIYMYSENGCFCYYYSEPIVGTRESIDLYAMPNHYGDPIVAVVHTHVIISVDSLSFSSMDIDNINELHSKGITIQSFLINPSGDILYYGPATSSGYCLCYCGCLYKSRGGTAIMSSTVCLN